MAKHNTLRRAHPEVDVTVRVAPNPESQDLLFIEFGMNASVQYAERRFAKKLGHLGTLATTIWPDYGVPVDSVKVKWLEIREAYPDHRLTVYGHSFGGHHSASLLSDSEFRSRLGTVQHLILDASYVQYGALSKESRRLLNLIRFCPAKRLLDRSELVRTNAVLLAQQAAFVRKYPLREGVLEGIAEQITCLQGPEDLRVNNTVALRGIRDAAGGQHVNHYVDSCRPAGNHQGASHFPEGFETIFALPDPTGY